MTCNHPYCQFKNFLNSKIYYYQERNGDTKCIFHISKEYKEKKFREIDKQLFNNILKNYLFQSKEKHIDINLSNVVFISTQVFKNNDFSNFSLNFDNAEFIDNIDFENIKCKELNLNNCKIYDGGRLKNRGSKDSLHIEKLIFKPYLLKSDFIIDLGNYVNENGLVETSNIGTIKYIKFSNQQLENGKVFFVGLNNNLKEADFTNKFLDNVIFHNSDLSKCRFLNSKILNTTFLNVHFDTHHNYFEYIIHKDNNSRIINLILIIPLFNIILEKIYLFLNRKKDLLLGMHICSYDEELLFNELKNNSSNNYKLYESYKNLQSLYEEFAINLKKTDSNLYKEFIYTIRHTKTLLPYNYFFDTFNFLIDHLHNIINGFGQRWFRPLIWFFLTIFIFSFIFNKPNIDYISTPNTPSFLINPQCSSEIPTTYNKDNFIKYINTKNLNYSNYFYGYDNRYNFKDDNKTKLNQMILKLNCNQTKFYKSISNLFYPFAPESKKWFQNISQSAIIWSFIETSLLWIFLLSFFRALWNKIKVDS